MALKNSVYVLPLRDESREDFAWVIGEIRQAGGEATLCEARLIDGLRDEDVRAAFIAAREKDYDVLAREVRRVSDLLRSRQGRSATAEKLAAATTAAARLRKQLAEVARIDFFAAPSREVVEGMLTALEKRLDGGANPTAAKPLSARHEAGRRKGQVWVTRKGVHVDRMASAWLIARHLDVEAKFKFVAKTGYEPEPGELRFDMFDAEFTHDGDLCTFEVLLREFSMRDSALTAIGQIVHDLDLKERKFDRPETAGIGHLVSGIAATHAEDEARLSSATVVFDALYGWFLESDKAERKR